MGSISRGGPGKHQIRARPMLACKPGAVPQLFFKQRAPLGRNACNLLFAVMGRPRSLNQRSRSASACSSTSNGSTTSMARRNASRVRSSSVGPSPPVMTRMSWRAESSRNMDSMSARSSCTVRNSRTTTPRNVNCEANHLALVSWVCPSINSSPTERMAALTPCCA